MKYSLANYILTVKADDASLKSTFGTISIGGEGSALDTVSAENTETLWSTESFATGAWIHNKNLSRVGTIDVSLSQLSTRVAKFVALCNTFFSGDYKGLTITLTDSNGQKIFSAVDCYITKIPKQEFSNSAGKQTWSFTAGQLTFN